MWWQAIIFVCGVQTPLDQCEGRPAMVIRPPTKFVAEAQCQTAMTIDLKNHRDHVVPLPFGRYSYVECEPVAREVIIGDFQ